MVITYDVFNEYFGTVGRYKSLEEAVKAAKKLGVYKWAIFKQISEYGEFGLTEYDMPELVKWVFPKKR